MGDPREGNSRPRDLQGHRKVGVKEKELLKTKRNHPGFADQELVCAGVGPGSLFLVIGNAVETSTVECMVCFMLLSRRVPLGTA